MKLFLAILFLVLIVTGISVFLCFIYLILLPAFSKKNVDVTDTSFSKSEMEFFTGSPEFTGNNSSTSEGLLKNNFQLWEKCYRIFNRK